MKPEILETYAKTIKDLEKSEIALKEIIPTKNRIRVEGGSFTISFKNNYDGEISVLPRLEFNKEESEAISNIILGIMIKKYETNNKEAKKAFQEMLIEKL